MFAPNGMKMDDWTPKSKGKLGKLPFILKPLQDLRSEITVLSRLDLEGGQAQGDGPGDHARASASFLTSAHPKKTGGADIMNGVSIDQRLAEHMGQSTRFASLELGMERGRSAGNCDSGYSCAYTNNISWRSPTTPVAKETQPRAVFQRLFGDLDSAEGRAAQLERERRRQSVLDFALDDAKKLRSKLGAQDRAKLDDYFDAVRRLEKRLSAKPNDNKAAVSPPKNLLSGNGGGFENRLDLMYEVLTLALQSDSTRIATFMLGNAGSNRSYRFLGVASGHHVLSHHGEDPEALKKLAKISHFHIDAFFRFLRRLADIKEADTTLLRNSLILYGSGLAHSDHHHHRGLPLLVAGRARGRVKAGRHLVFKKGTPAANLYLSILKKAGAKDAQFGDSTGVLPSF